MMMQNDIGLLRLKINIQYGVNVKPVDLSGGPLPLKGDYKATAIGFGRVEVPIYNIINVIFLFIYLLFVVVVVCL